MLIHLPTQKMFANRKEAKKHFGCNNYRRLLKTGEIYNINDEHCNQWYTTQHSPKK